MKVSYNALADTAPEPAKLRINLREKALVWSFFDQLKAWAWPAHKVDTLCVVVQAQHPTLDLSDETEAARRRHAQLQCGPLYATR